MLGWINSRIAHRRGLIIGILGALAIVQSLRLHAHTFADHLARFGHTHPAEIHVVGSPTAAGHNDVVDNETADQFAINAKVVAFFQTDFSPLIAFVLVVLATHLAFALSSVALAFRSPAFSPTTSAARSAALIVHFGANS